MHNQYANTAGDTSQEAKNQHDESHIDDALLRQVRDLKSKLKAEKEKSAKLKKMLSTRTAEYNELKAQVGINNVMLGGLIKEVKTLQNHVRQGHESLEAEMKALNSRTGSSTGRITDKSGDKGEEDIEVTLKHGRGRPRKRSEAEPSSAPRRKRQRPRKSLD
ncbi:autophagy-related protein 11 [Colletotrichum asianum]|uniref:Autophagy-related protein 11 n=1 Tax=Colletotrichum asianum TaxID=702518 RepID=A0A8H3VY23_9PEZI|nr:autophagy-related protein 11 [Colletotrichum asianum]